MAYITLQLIWHLMAHITLALNDTFWHLPCFLLIIGSDNGLSPYRRQAIIWINAGILLIWTLGTNFSEILIEILTFSFKEMRLKLSPVKWQPFCLGLNVFMAHIILGPPATYHPGPWFNFKISSHQYRKFRCGDNTVIRSSYLHNKIPYTGKTASLYWIRPLVCIDTSFWHLMAHITLEHHFGTLWHM